MPSALPYACSTSMGWAGAKEDSGPPWLPPCICTPLLPHQLTHFTRSRQECGSNSVA